jgi:DNA processing protein
VTPPERIATDDPRYPPRLLELADPPASIWVRAQDPSAALAALVSRRSVAIVGARQAGPLVLAFTRRLAADLTRTGIAILSGLALGADAAAHEGSLEAAADFPPTHAVLACDPSTTYPRRHTRLAERMLVAGGAILSEYPPGTPPAPWRFPARNRLIAALAEATIVVEASTRSGALITASAALELGREVMVVPASPWERRSSGGNRLLIDGATPVLGAAEVLYALGLDPGTVLARTDPSLSEAAARVLAAVRREPGTPERLAVSTGRPVAEVQGALLELELSGLIVRERDGAAAAP